MLTGLLLLLDLAAAPAAAACAPAAITAQVDKAVALTARNDFPGATTALGGGAQCPPTSYPAYLAHVLRADLAVREGDWPAATAALDGIEVHPELRLSARAGFLRLRADQGRGDATAFGRDRAALIEANDTQLAQAGRRIETFRAGTATVTSYEAAVDQGPFHRTIEFIIVPDDPAAYPASILLTDDRQAALVAAQLAKPGETKREHVWFLDLYTCLSHSTLSPPSGAGTGAPAYPDLKTRVVATLADASISTAAPGPANAICFSTPWILPGLGRARAATTP